MEIDFNNSKPILIAGPTASGKSALGIDLAQRFNGVVINADALQVYSQWHVLTARPSAEEIELCPHRMYGHIDIGAPYSAGHWLADVRKALVAAAEDGLRPIILGGTGLYFQLLTNGIAEIPEIPSEIKHQADIIEKTDGKHAFAALLRELDPNTLLRIDHLNPVRTRRAWEVIAATGKGLSRWQEETPPPLLEIEECIGVNLVSEADWLNERIERRFDNMIDAGALGECQSVLDAGLWDESHPSCKAIGAKELVAHITNGTDLDIAISEAKTQTRRYAKRQRTWFRSKMSNWNSVHIADS